MFIGSAKKDDIVYHGLFAPPYPNHIKIDK